MYKLEPLHWYKNLGQMKFIYIMNSYIEDEKTRYDYIMISSDAEQNLVAVKSEMVESCPMQEKLYKINNPSIKPSTPFTIKTLFIIKQPGKKINCIETENGKRIYGGTDGN